MHPNPFSQTGFEMQICCLIIAPAFLAAGVYLTLKHLVIAFGPEYSLLRPAYYTWIFILCDILSLIIQGAGGGIAASAPPDDSKSTKLGGNLMLAGIVWQVFTMLVFAGLAADFFLRVYRNRSRLNSSTEQLWRTVSFKLYLAALATALLAIFTRCVYRYVQ